MLAIYLVALLVSQPKSLQKSRLAIYLVALLVSQPKSLQKSRLGGKHRTFSATRWAEKEKIIWIYPVSYPT